MKKLLCFFILLTFLSTLETQACDVCGCGVGNYYLGVTPQIQKNVIGLRYRQQRFDSHLGHTHEGEKAFASTETFNTAELWARYYIKTRWQLTAFLPYQFNHKKDETGTKRLHGIGDGLLMLQYNLFNSFLRVDTVSRTFQHNWFVGGGLKAPFGRYKYVEDANTVANPNFQLGSGSWDWLVSTSYTIRYKKSGFTTDFSYKSNGKNSNRYRFGDRISVNSAVFTLLNKNLWSFMPSLGASYEHSAVNYSKGYPVDFTGGNMLMGNLATDVFYKDFTFGALLQMPIRQSLGGGNIQSKSRLMVQAAYVF